MRERDGQDWLPITILLLIFAVLVVSSAVRKTITGDELAHLGAGYSYLHTGDFRLNHAHPPLLKELAAVPVMLLGGTFDPQNPDFLAAREDRFGQHVFFESGMDVDTMLFLSRIPTLLLALGLALLIFRWAAALYGRAGGFFALALFAFAPSTLAHAGIFDMDMGAATLAFLATFQFVRYLRGPTLRKAALTGVALGLALAAKFTTLALLGLLPTLWLITWLSKRAAGDTDARWQADFAAWRRWAGHALLMLALAGLVISFTYLFVSTPAYFGGIAEQLQHNAEGDPEFFMGQLGWTGWTAYFPVAFLIKTPLAMLAFLLIGLLSLLWPGSRRRLEETFPLLAATFFFVPALFSHINIGLRHVLPMMPFLFVFAARVTTIRLRWRGVWRIALAGLCAWFLWASFSIYPDYLAYFNELIGGPKNGIYYLGDSNIDWGQDLKQLAVYLRSQGTDEVILSYFGDADLTYYGIRYQYAPAYGYQGPLWKRHDYTLSPDAKREFLAVSVNNLQGTFFQPKDYDLYRWLYDREPVKRVGYSIYVYDITGDADAHVQLGGVYSRYAMYDMARLEFEKALQIDPQRADARNLLDSLPQGPSAAP